MAQSLIARKNWNLEDLLPDSEFNLNEFSARNAYEDGKRTDTLEGFMYTVTGTTSFEQIRVFVKQQRPLISSEELDSCKEAGEHVFVRFENATVRPYSLKESSTINDSIKADDIIRCIED